MQSLLVAYLVLALAAQPQAQSQHVPLEQWSPQQGDRIVVDTQKNMGYIVHPNLKYTSFPAITGQRRTVRYIGKQYYAGTRNWDWEIRDLDEQPDLFTYGPEGHFLRLFHKTSDGTRRTHYGFHSHAAHEKMFARENRFQSMGCIIVQPHVLSVIMETFRMNNKSVIVRTRWEVENPVNVAYPERVKET